MGEIESDLNLKIRFLDAPPYQSNWWPWSVDHFRIEASICNTGDSTWAIKSFSPCNDCNPKFHLEEVNSSTEVEREWELDIMYVFREGYLGHYLFPDSCFVDSMDVGEWIQYNIENNKQYKFWIEYVPFFSDKIINLEREYPLWQNKLVSDTLYFEHE